MIKYLEQIITDKQLENEEVSYFNLNPDWYEQLQKEAGELMYIQNPKDDQYRFDEIMLLGKKITIDCRGWENKWGGWYFENDIVGQNIYHTWKDIMFNSVYLGN